MTVLRSARITATMLGATMLGVCLALPAHAQVAKATLKNADGKTVGEANLVQGATAC